MAATEQDRLAVARIGHAGRPYALGHGFEGSERREAIAALRWAAEGRGDLLAEYAGLVQAFCDPNIGLFPVTHLCIDAGADSSKIPEWEEEGRKRKEQLRDVFLDKSEGRKRINHEDPLVERFWKAQGCPGRLYPQFPVDSRRIDNVIVLNMPFGINDKGEATCLTGKHIIIVQAKESRLNPSLVGQALLSGDMIRQCHRPVCVRSVAICIEDDPDICMSDWSSEVEACLVQQHCDYRNNKPPRCRIAWSSLGFTGRESEPWLSNRVRVPGMLIDGVPSGPGPIREDQVRGRDVISLHSYHQSLGMWVAGEVIVAHQLLSKAEPSSIRSLIRCRRKDQPVEQALNRYVTIEASAQVDGCQQYWIRPLDSEKREWPRDLIPPST